MAENDATPEPDLTDAALSRTKSGLGAVALGLARKAIGGKADPKLDAFLEQQTELAAAQSRLAAMQMEHLQEEQELHRRHSGLKYFSDRLRVGLQLLGVAAGLAVITILATLAWQAHEDRGLVIDAFAIPADVARNGLTGQVAAQRFLDKLQILQAATASERPAATYQNNWGSDIKVEIPQTGLTFGEFERLLRDKLGHTSHVTGEVLRTPAGITLTARFADEPPQTFAGAAPDFDSLAQKAAEAVYGASQPHRYGQYLAQHGRLDEAIAIDTALAANGPQSERAWAYASLAQIHLQLGDLAAALTDIAAGRAAGGAGVEWVDIQGLTAEVWAGHDEALLEDSRLFDRTETQTRHPEVSEAAFQENRLISSGYLAGQTGAFLKAATDYMTLASTAHVLSPRPISLAQAASAYALDHDRGRALQALSQAGQALNAAFYDTEAVQGYYAMPMFEIDAARNDWPAALAAVREADAVIEADKPAHPSVGLLQPVLIRPLQALALARTGDIPGARALIAGTAMDCYRCLRVRGQIAAAAADGPAAEHWFAEAIRQAPQVPFAYEELGEARFARGDLPGAIAAFQASSAREPRFADPLKGRGDALARQGHWRDALAKYDAALKVAPHWAALQQARDVAARHPG